MSGRVGYLNSDQFLEQMGLTDLAGLTVGDTADPTSIVDVATGDGRYATAGSGVTSFNTRTGAVTLTSADVTGALAYTPTSVTGLTGAQSVAAFKSGLSLVKGDVGLGSVDNTADTAKSVLSAATLTTGRTIGMTGDVTWTSGSFNGSAAVTGTSAIGANKVLDTMIRQSAGLSVIGRSANSTGDVADIAAASDGQVLRRSGTALGFGAVSLSTAAAVTGILPIANGGTGDSGTAWTAYTPTVTADSGTMPAYTASGAYKQIGKTVFFRLKFTIGAGGAPATGYSATLPVAAVSSGQNQPILGKETAAVGCVVGGIILTGGTQLRFIQKYDGTFMSASGYVFELEGAYEAA